MARRAARGSNWKRRITSDPRVCHGKPRVEGTRVLVSSILGSLGAGHTREEVLAGYPAITDKDIDAALAFAAELANGRSVSA